MLIPRLGIQPSGATQLTNDPNGPIEIPEGTYDVGDGYYHPIHSIIYSYDGEIKRTPSEKEVEWIVAKCRYNPRKNIPPITGDDDKVVKKVRAENAQADTGLLTSASKQ